MIGYYPDELRLHTQTLPPTSWAFKDICKHKHNIPNDNHTISHWIDQIANHKIQLDSAEDYAWACLLEIILRNMLDGKKIAGIHSNQQAIPSALNDPFFQLICYSTRVSPNLLQHFLEETSKLDETHNTRGMTKLHEQLPLLKVLNVKENANITEAQIAAFLEMKTTEGCRYSIYLSYHSASLPEQSLWLNEYVLPLATVLKDSRLQHCINHCENPKNVALITDCLLIIQSSWESLDNSNQQFAFELMLNCIQSNINSEAACKVIAGLNTLTAKQISSLFQAIINKQIHTHTLSLEDYTSEIALLEKHRLDNGEAIAMEFLNLYIHTTEAQKNYLAIIARALLKATIKENSLHNPYFVVPNYNQQTKSHWLEIQGALWNYYTNSAKQILIKSQLHNTFFIILYFFQNNPAADTPEAMEMTKLFLIYLSNPSISISFMEPWDFIPLLIQYYTTLPAECADGNKLSQRMLIKLVNNLITTSPCDNDQQTVQLIQLLLALKEATANTPLLEEITLRIEEIKVTVINITKNEACDNDAPNLLLSPIPASTEKTILALWPTFTTTQREQLIPIFNCIYLSEEINTPRYISREILQIAYQAYQQQALTPNSQAPAKQKALTKVEIHTASSTLESNTGKRFASIISELEKLEEKYLSRRFDLEVRPGRRLSEKLVATRKLLEIAKNPGQEKISRDAFPGAFDGNLNETRKKVEALILLHQREAVLEITQFKLT